MPTSLRRAGYSDIRIRRQPFLQALQGALYNNAEAFPAAFGLTPPHKTHSKELPTMRNSFYESGIVYFGELPQNVTLQLK